MSTLGKRIDRIEEAMTPRTPAILWAHDEEDADRRAEEYRAKTGRPPALVFIWALEVEKETELTLEIDY